LTKSSYSSVEQQGLDFVTFSLVPWLRRWEACIRRDLILDDETYFAEFDVRGLMRGDNAARAAYFKELWQLGVLSINEIRESEGLNPIESGDKRFVQVNMALLESFTVEPPAAEVPPPVAEQVPPAEEEPPASEEQPAPAMDQVAREVVFSTTLRKLANLEAEGIIERRNKPQKLAAWLEAHERKMRIELRDAAEATGRQIDDFVVSWMNKTRELLLDCHRSGLKYETVMESWCEQHQNNDASTT
jgi:hypothetical protein